MYARNRTRVLVGFAISEGDGRDFDGSRVEEAIDAGLRYRRLDDSIEEDLLIFHAERKVIRDLLKPLPPFFAVLVERVHHERRVDQVPERREGNDDHQSVRDCQADVEEGEFPVEFADRLQPGIDPRIEIVEHDDPEHAPEVRRQETAATAAKNQVTHVISP